MFVTHDITEAFTLGDQVAVLSTGGHIEQAGRPLDLLTSPASTFVADFVGASRAARPVRVTGSHGLVMDEAGTPVGTLTQGTLTQGGDEASAPSPAPRGGAEPAGARP